MNNKSFNFFHVTSVPWILVYALFIFGAAAYASYFYVQYDEDQIPTGYVELMLGKEAYQLGETVTFTVVNHFPTIVYVTNQCPEKPFHVFRWVEDEWRELHSVTSDAESECHTEERNVAIPPEGTRTYSFEDWPDLFAAPGVYRIAMVVDHYGDVPFKDFVVLEPPEVIEIEVVRNRAESPPAPDIVPESSIVDEIRENDDYEIEEEDDLEYEEEHEHEHEHEEDDD